MVGGCVAEVFGLAGLDERREAVVVVEIRLEFESRLAHVGVVLPEVEAEVGFELADAVVREPLEVEREFQFGVEVVAVVDVLPVEVVRDVELAAFDVAVDDGLSGVGFEADVDLDFETKLAAAEGRLYEVEGKPAVLNEHPSEVESGVEIGPAVVNELHPVVAVAVEAGAGWDVDEANHTAAHVQPPESALEIESPVAAAAQVSVPAPWQDSVAQIHESSPTPAASSAGGPPTEKAAAASVVSAPAVQAYYAAEQKEAQPYHRQARETVQQSSSSETPSAGDSDPEPSSAAT